MLFKHEDEEGDEEEAAAAFCAVSLPFRATETTRQCEKNQAGQVDATPMKTRNGNACVT